MSYIITEDCVNCQLCKSECPTQAIQSKEGVLTIDSHLCNDCVGYYGMPQCASICPTNTGCIPSPLTVSHSSDYWENWFTRYNRIIHRLNQQKQELYWHKWFDTYSQKLTFLHS